MRRSLAGYGDLLAGFRITSISWIAVLDGESPEAPDLDPLAVGQSIGHAVEDRVDDALNFFLGKILKVLFFPSA